MRRILIEAVAKTDMRPPYNASDAAGDWFINQDGDLVIRVTGDDLDDHTALLFALHEFVEAMLCRANGVDQQRVDDFDAVFAAEREAGMHDEDAEPGDAPRSPYRKEHRQAMLIEHLMAQFLGLDAWGIVR